MRIRRLEIDDLSTRVQWMNNPKVYGSMHFDIPVSMEKTYQWFEKNRLAENRADFAFCADNGEIMAFGGITSIDRKLGKGEVYLFVNPDNQSKGIGTKALKLMCNHAFTAMNLNKLFLYTNEDNHISIHLYEKTGFILEGRMRREYLSADGYLMDRMYYGLLKEEWKDGQ